MVVNGEWREKDKKRSHRNLLHAFFCHARFAHAVNSSLFFDFRIIVDKIDENKDKFVDMSELKNWISFTQRRYIEDDVDRQWKQHNPDNTEQINWEVSHAFFSFKLARCDRNYLAPP